MKSNSTACQAPQLCQATLQFGITIVLVGALSDGHAAVLHATLKKTIKQNEALSRNNIWRLPQSINICSG